MYPGNILALFPHIPDRRVGVMKYRSGNARPASRGGFAFQFLDRIPSFPFLPSALIASPSFSLLFHVKWLHLAGISRSPTLRRFLIHSFSTTKACARNYRTWALLFVPCTCTFIICDQLWEILWFGVSPKFSGLGLPGTGLHWFHFKFRELEAVAFPK